MTEGPPPRVYAKTLFSTLSIKWQNTLHFKGPPNQNDMMQAAKNHFKNSGTNDAFASRGWHIQIAKKRCKHSAMYKPGQVLSVVPARILTHWLPHYSICMYTVGRKVGPVWSFMSHWPPNASTSGLPPFSHCLSVVFLFFGRRVLERGWRVKAVLGLRLDFLKSWLNSCPSLISRSTWHAFLTWILVRMYFLNNYFRALLLTMHVFALDVRVQTWKLGPYFSLFCCTFCGCSVVLAPFWGIAVLAIFSETSREQAQHGGYSFQSFWLLLPQH